MPEATATAASAKTEDARARLAKLKAAREAARSGHAAPTQQHAEAQEQEIDENGEEKRTPRRDDDVKESIKKNPIFLAIHGGAEREETLAKLSNYIDSKEGKYSETMKALRDYAYFLQMVRKELSVGQIKTTVDKNHVQMTQALDNVFANLGQFKEIAQPMREGYELLQKYISEDQENEDGLSLTDRISQALLKHKEMQKAQIERTHQAELLEAEATTLVNHDMKALVDKKAAVEGARFQFAHQNELKTLAADIAAKQKEIDGKRDEAKTLRAMPLIAEDEKDFDPNLLRFLDASGPEFAKQANEMSNKALSIISETQAGLDEGVLGMLESQEDVSKLLKQAGDIDLYVATLKMAVERTLEKQKAEGAEAKAVAVTDVEKLEEKERNLAAGRKTRYNAELVRFNTSLEKTADKIKEGRIILEVLDQNIAEAIDSGVEMGSETIATVSETVSTFVQSIYFESNASKIDMIGGVLASFKAAAETVREGQIRMLPRWLGRDIASMEKSLDSIRRLDTVLTETREELQANKDLQVQLRRDFGDAIDGFQQAVGETRSLMISTEISEAGTASDETPDTQDTEPSKPELSVPDPFAGVFGPKNG